MKKLLLAVATAIVSMSVNAQTIEIQKTEGGTTTTVATYDNTSNVSYKVILKKTPTTGTAKAIVDGTEVNIGWVQLWKDGPKFATRNVGATGENDKESSLGNPVALNNDIWGENWTMPSQSVMASFNNKNLVTITKDSQDNVSGFKITGVQDGYTDNSIFLPGSSYGTSTFNPGDGYVDYYYYMFLGSSENYFVLQDISENNSFYFRPILK